MHTFFFLQKQWYMYDVLKMIWILFNESHDFSIQAKPCKIQKTQKHIDIGSIYEIYIHL